MPASTYAPSLTASLSEVTDPRQPRGVRHPFSGILALALLGLVCRRHEFAALRRWAAGNPVQRLNVFAQDVQACLGQWPLSGDKLTEPEALKAHLSELFEKYPAWRLITGDALYAQRHLADLILASGHDSLLQLNALKLIGAEN